MQEDQEKEWPSITAIPSLAMSESLQNSELKPTKELPNNDSDFDQYSNDSGLGDCVFRMSNVFLILSLLIPSCW